jgi:hypothetical protein
VLLPKVKITKFLPFNDFKIGVFQVFMILEKAKYHLFEHWVARYVNGGGHYSLASC